MYIDNLKNNFGKKIIDKSTKTSLVQNVFSKVSNKYDLMNDIMSLGFHRLWKKRLIEIINLQKNEYIIDVGSGTGDLAKLILDKKIKSNLYCVDLNYNMLKEAKKKISFKKNNNIKFIKANAENIPFENNFFDKYLISFCLRNITSIDLALKEAIRVLKPGGEFYCLEFSTPVTNLVNLIYSKYKNKVIPIMGDKFAKDFNAYKYLEESIDQFPHQDILLENLKETGFQYTSYSKLFDGIVSIHKGFKI